VNPIKGKYHHSNIRRTEYLLPHDSFEDAREVSEYVLDEEDVTTEFVLSISEKGDESWRAHIEYVKE
jgi:hypothetical protein